MKKLDIKIDETYKAYRQGTEYSLEGDLIVLSGINGSGKSQLLQIISENSKQKISRRIFQTQGNGESISLAESLLLSFRDNIDLGKDFGPASVIYREEYITAAWQYYVNNIKYTKSSDYDNKKRKERYLEGTLIYNNKGVRDPSWRSINELVRLLNSAYSDDKIFNLSQDEFKRILPNSFIWRNEKDIISLVGNLFYIACCDRAVQQIKYSSTKEIFDNATWLKTAPWTILNELFEELNFKYRFKKDYQFSIPDIEENPKLRDNSEIRNLIDLSDGEKAILKLALCSLDEEISKDIKLVLFDEYDAPLNPSLTESFYHVVEKFYIEKGIQVIVTTHSPATISLAPDYAHFYEIFSQTDASPKIVSVDQFEYSELRIANKQYYDRIRNQNERIAELERLKENTSGKMLFVEDEYTQIYKIAYLKVKGVEGISEENLDEKFEEHCGFTIHGGFSCGGLYNRLTIKNITSDQNSVIIGLFDFDNEGYHNFEKYQI